MYAMMARAPREQLDWIEVADPSLPPHGALIEVRATGVCRSDWHAWMGHDASVVFPHVLGHEFAGVVTAVGGHVERWKVGQRVTAPFCCGCGVCRTCQRGLQNLCDHEYQPGFSGWGSFAEAVVVPWADTNLVELPEELDFVHAASLGCRFITSYHGLIERAGLRAGESVAVFGCGGVGLSAVLIATAMGARVIAVDISDDKLALAESLGAATVVNSLVDDPVEVIRRLGGVEVSVDALGSVGTFTAAVSSLNKRGRHLQLGLLLEKAEGSYRALQGAIGRELTILGGHGMPARSYGGLFSFLSQSGVDLAQLVGEVRPMSDAGIAVERMGAYASLGVTVLVPNG